MTGATIERDDATACLVTQDARRALPYAELLEELWQDLLREVERLAREIDAERLAAATTAAECARDAGRA